jgi:hypothetical protein
MAARAVSTSHGLPPHTALARKITKYESPEKWLLCNDDWKYKAIANKSASERDGLLVWRLLVDALCWKCGYRNVESTAEDRRRWQQKKAETGGTRFSAVMRNKDRLADVGLSVEDLEKLVSGARQIRRQ